MLGLEKDTAWDNLGGLKLDLVGCLAAAWIIVCLCLIKGVQSSGKVLYLLDFLIFRGGIKSRKLWGKFCKLFCVVHVKILSFIL